MPVCPTKPGGALKRWRMRSTPGSLQQQALATALDRALLRWNSILQQPAPRSNGWGEPAQTEVPQKQLKTTRWVFGMVDISYLTLAGCYGIFAHSKKGYICQNLGARDVLVLQRDGSYAVYLAKHRTP